MVILGIDPGSSITGYGVIRAEKSDGLRHFNSGCIRTSPNQDFLKRIKHIYDQITIIISTTHPDHVVLEDIFFGRNVKSAIQLGQARGAAILAALNVQLPVMAYSAKEVKQAVTGNGSASKEQVRHMVSRLLKTDFQKSPMDVTDALAVAICHAHRLERKFLADGTLHP